MNPKLTSRILASTAASAVLLVMLAFALWGGKSALGAAIAGVIAILNAAVIAWVAKRATDRKFSAGGLTVVVLLKTVTLMLTCWVCIVRLNVDFDGFTLGIGALVLGVLLGSALSPPAPSTHATHEEEVS